MSADFTLPRRAADNLVDTDKLVTVKGLVIRATPVIPDMTTGE